jgi:hypothetical protein
MRALGIPDNVAKQFPDVEKGRVHSYMLHA